MFTRIAVLSLPALTLLAGCDPATCACEVFGQGDPVDFTALTPDVDAMIGGTWTGTVSNKTTEVGQDTVLETCSLIGQPFSLELNVSQPESCWDSEQSPEDCSSAHGTSYPLGGTLELDGSWPITGFVGAWSEKPGVNLSVSMDPPPTGVPYATMDVILSSTLLDEAQFESVLWSRRLSEDDAPQTTWELCSLDVLQPE